MANGCQDGHICFYEEPEYNGNLETHEGTPSGIRNLDQIPLAKSVHNWTGDDVMLHTGRDGEGDSFPLAADNSRRNSEPIRSYSAIG